MKTTKPKLVQILVSNSSFRLEYVLKHIEQSYTNIQFQVVYFPNTFEPKGNSISLNYTDKTLNSDFAINPNSFLFEKEIRKKTPKFEFLNDKWFFFKTQTSFENIPFDIFSFIFYYLSRYEEYQIKDRDEHNRFNYKHCLEYKNNCIILPIVDFWLSFFLKDLFPNETFKNHTEFIPTFDIDKAWVFEKDNSILWFASLIKEIKNNKKNLLRARLLNLFGDKDPYDIYDYLFSILKENDLSALFFIPVGIRTFFDKNTNPRSLTFIRLIKEIQKKYQLGIHPSYISNNDCSYLDAEFLKFRNLTLQNPTFSRQHYLMLSFPDTYRRLIERGIKKDFSMVYSDNIGYRAGTSYPFFWFDLENNKETDLKIYPAQIMDVTFRFYKKVSPEIATKDIEMIIGQVKKYGGCFIPIWHNSSFTPLFGWQLEWRTVFSKMIHAASLLNKRN